MLPMLALKQEIKDQEKEEDSVSFGKIDAAQIL
jgi:hypothetical protein